MTHSLLAAPKRSVHQFAKIGTLLPLLLVLSACERGSTPVAPMMSDSGAADAGTTDAVEAGTDAGSPDTAIPDSWAYDDCATEARWVYLTGFNREFLRFEPDTNTITNLGTLPCEGDVPHNMSVDRDGTAWVIDQLGSLFHVDVSDLSCTRTSFMVSQDEFEFRGMAFVNRELYVSSANGELGTIGQDDLSLNFVSRDVPAPLKLTGTGAGDLWGMAMGSMHRLEETTGETLEEFTLADAETFQSAFAFWGGRFYIFLPEGGEDGGRDRGTVIRVWTPGEAEVREVGRTDVRVVGAGSSTCAPSELI